ncbi:MAG: hypothetical protein EPN91_04025, partial [Salinibacterium sp.]
MNDTAKQLLRSALLLLLAFFALHGLTTVGKYVGYASFSGAAGNIYELVISHRIPVTEWSGQYGVTVRVDGFTFQQTHTFNPGEIANINLLYNCLQPDTQHETYASVYDPLTLDFSSVTPATAAQVDAFYGLNSSGASSTANTLTANITFQFGATTITAPGTYTYKIDENGAPATFAMMALKDATGKLFFGSILTNFTAGYNGDIINYQMLVPMLQNQSTTKYYYFTDPNDHCPAGIGSLPPTGLLIGNVSSQTGARLQGVIVDVASTSALSDATGFYNMSPSAGTWRIYAILTGYIPYVNNITITANNTTIHDIVMIQNIPPNPNTGIGPGIGPGVGPGQGPGVDVGPGKAQGPGQDQGPGEAPPVPFVEQPKQIEGTDYIISLADLRRKL